MQRSSHHTNPFVHSTRDLVQISCLLLLLTSRFPVFAGVELQILAIGDAPVSSLPQVEAVVSVQGELSWRAEPMPAVVLQVAWRRPGEEAWWIEPQTRVVEQTAARQEWEFTAVRLGNAFDARKDLEVLVCASLPGKVLPEGALDFRSLSFSCLAVSPRIPLRRQAGTPAQLLVTPRVRVARVADQPFVSGQIHEVGLSSLFSGEVRKPTNSLLRLVIQPLNSAMYWVMEDEPLLRDGRWVAKADFVSNGFEDESEFAVFAVITREPLPQGIPIPQHRWSSFLAEKISSASPVVRVTRIEVPPSKNQVGVRILAVNGMPVNTRQTWQVPRQSPIRGVLTGRPLSSSEAVWILAADQYDAGRWRAIGKATQTGKNQWELAPQQLGEPGAYLRLIALVTREAVDDLPESELKESLAYSRQIPLRIQEEPAMQVTIESVDRHRVSAGTGMEVARVAAVEGSISGRPLGTGDRVWILKMDQHNQQKWQLVGQAAIHGRQSWSMPPVAIGNNGDEILLMAVVSKTALTNLSVEEQQHVLASSPRVRVTLR